MFSEDRLDDRSIIHAPQGLGRRHRSCLAQVLKNGRIGGEVTRRFSVTDPSSCTVRESRFVLTHAWTRTTSGRTAN
jgi:hypothetical protein